MCDSVDISKKQKRILSSDSLRAVMRIEIKLICQNQIQGVAWLSWSFVILLFILTFVEPS